MFFTCVVWWICTISNLGSLYLYFLNIFSNSLAWSPIRVTNSVVKLIDLLKNKNNTGIFELNLPIGWVRGLFIGCFLEISMGGPPDNWIYISMTWPTWLLTTFFHTDRSRRSAVTVGRLSPVDVAEVRSITWADPSCTATPAKQEKGIGTSTRRTSYEWRRLWETAPCL